MYIKEKTMSSITILGLMLASDGCESPGRCYKNMVEACKKTWINSSTENCKIFAVYGKQGREQLLNNQSLVIIEDCIIVNTTEARSNLLKKTIKAMEYCLEYHQDYDYFFRPNCGSYVNTRLLKEFLLDKPRTNYYSSMNGLFNGIKYGSGACILFSKDIVKILVENQDKLEYNGEIYMDDVAIGKFLNTYGIPLQTDALRYICNNEQEIESKIDSKCYHYYFNHTINPNLIYKCHKLTVEKGFL